MRRAIEEDGAVYLRGRVSRIYRSGDHLIVKGADTLSGAAVEIEADMVVLATAIMPQPGIEGLFQKLGISYDQYKFASEAHPKLRPVECATAGIFLAGACQGPKDIPEAVAQASGASASISRCLEARRSFSTCRRSRRQRRPFRPRRKRRRRNRLRRFR